MCLTFLLILNYFFIVHVHDLADGSTHTPGYHSSVTYLGCIRTTEPKARGPLCAQNKQMHLRCPSRFRIPLSASKIKHLFINSFIHLLEWKGILPQATHTKTNIPGAWAQGFTTVWADVQVEMIPFIWTSRCSYLYHISSLLVEGNRYYEGILQRYPKQNRLIRL